MDIGAKVDDSKVQVVLKKLAKKGRDFKPVLTVIGEDMKLWVKESIDKQRDPVTGQAWPKRRPLSQMSRVGGSGGKTLFDNGHLLQSFASAVPKVTATTVRIGTNLPYARIHQKGGTVKAKRARVLMIPMSVEAKRAGNARRFIEQKKGQGTPPFFIKTSKGRLLLVYNKTKKKKSDGARRVPGQGGQAKGNLVFAYYCPRQVRISATALFGLWQTRRTTGS